MLKKHKTFFIAAGAAFAVAAVIIALTVSTLIARRNEKAAAYALGSFGAYAAAQLDAPAMSPLLASMFARMEPVSAQLSPAKDAIEVSFTLPELDDLRDVGSEGSFNPASHAPDPLRYIAMFEAGCLSAAQTSDRREHTISFPVKFSLLNFEVNMSGLGYADIAAQYRKDFCEALEARIAASSLGGAVRAYLFPGSDGAGEEGSRFRARMEPFLNPAGVALTVDDHGGLFIDVSRYDSGELLQYAASELSNAYASEFLAAAVTWEDIDADLSSQILASVFDPPAAAEAPAPPAGINMKHETYRLHIGSAVPDMQAISASILSELIGSLEKYDDAVFALKEQADSLPVNTPLPEPDSGLLSGTSTGSYLVIENIWGFGPCFLVISPASADAPAETSFEGIGMQDVYEMYAPAPGDIMSVYIREGEIHAVRLPAGSYDIKYAFGQSGSWFGREHLFGPAGRYYLAAAAITIDAGTNVLTFNTADTIGRRLGETAVYGGAQPPAAEGVSLRYRSADLLKSQLERNYKEKPPYLVYVSKNSFTIAILGLDGAGEYTRLLYTFHTGVGRTSGQTRAGNYTITSKERWHLWTSGNVSPYATGHSGGLWFHGPVYNTRTSQSMIASSYNEIGTAATSGCMRTYTSAAYWIYSYCVSGTPVIIANDSKYASYPRSQVEPSQRYDPTDPNIVIEGTER